tara:strand:+ start:166 stop:447 length:282 start_codon:yes stop_codon:yes gene_type:complete
MEPALAIIDLIIASIITSAATSAFTRMYANDKADDALAAQEAELEEERKRLALEPGAADLFLQNRRRALQEGGMGTSNTVLGGYNEGSGGLLQ